MSVKYDKINDLPTSITDAWPIADVLAVIIQRCDVGFGEIDSAADVFYNDKRFTRTQISTKCVTGPMVSRGCLNVGNV